MILIVLDVVVDSSKLGVDSFKSLLKGRNVGVKGVDGGIGGTAD